MDYNMTLLVFSMVFYLIITVKAENCTALANASNCDFYSQCVELKFQCGTNGYPLAYGNRYCHHLKNKQSCFTSAVSIYYFSIQYSLLSYRVKYWLII